MKSRISVRAYAQGMTRGRVMARYRIVSRNEAFLVTSTSRINFGYLRTQWPWNWSGK